jgi:heat shock protein HslJ
MRAGTISTCASEGLSLHTAAMRWVSLAAAAGLLLTSTACSTDAARSSGRQTQEISGAWYLVTGSYSGESINPDPLRRVTLVTDPQNTGKPHDIAGFSGCNWYSVGLDYLGTLEAGTATSTLINCSEASGQVETLFRSALADVDKVAQTSGSLVLTGGKSSLTFAPIPPVPREAMLEHRWILESITTGDVTSPESAVPARGPTASLELSDDGKAIVSTGCGQFQQDWTIFLGEMRIMDGAMHGMDSCPPSLYRQHDSVLEVLFDFTPTLDGDRLLLQGQFGSGLVYRLAGRE